jgi:hypothetical protein
MGLVIGNQTLNIAVVKNETPKARTFFIEYAEYVLNRKHNIHNM